VESTTSRKERRGIRTDSTGKLVQNSILQAIPECEYNLLRGHLEPRELPQRHILHEAGDKIEFAYFLNNGMASLVVLTSDGRSVEVAIVGKEGIVGTPLAVGLNRGPHRAVMQIAGACVRVSSAVLGDTLRSAPEMQLIWNRYVLIQGLQVAQIAACNRLHEIAQRLARWLLMCQDRVDSKMLRVTHEFLAQMLGTGRPSVSLAAGILQRGGLIENERGAVTIRNRPGLEAAACECYLVMQRFSGVSGTK
jgi:CRP-like cAMP-binding protein